MSQQWDAKDKTFLITGGASGLGAQYAKTFLELGAKKVAVLDVAVAVGEKFVAELNEKYPGKAIFIKCDVSKESEIDTSFEKVLKDFQRIDVIINNAGIMSDDANLWRTACDVNWQGLISFTLRGMAHMRKDEGGNGGTIINISSIAALFKIPTMPIYCGSKMAVLHFSQSLVDPQFFERTGIRILTMCFGATATPLLDHLIERAIDKKYAEEFYGKHETKLQKVESAVKAFVQMFQEGSCGSIWLSINDKPLKEITQLLDNHYKEYEKLLLS